MMFQKQIASLADFQLSFSDFQLSFSVVRVELCGDAQTPPAALLIYLAIWCKRCICQVMKWSLESVFTGGRFASASLVLHWTFPDPLKWNFFPVISFISSNALQANWMCPRATPLRSHLIKPRWDSSRSYITDVLTKDAIGLLPALPLLPICTQPFLP